MSSCWTVASSQIDVGGYVKPGGAGILTLGASTGKILDRGWTHGKWADGLLSC